MTGLHGTTQARLVAKLRVPANADLCWIWTGHTIPNSGYGQMGEGLAHRVAYEVFIGPIPEGMKIDHVCHNAAFEAGLCAGGSQCEHRKCCNPWHLEAKTQAENLNGGANDWTTRETCKNGHDKKYRHRSPKGQTYCKQCRADVKKRARIIAAQKRQSNGATR